MGQTNTIDDNVISLFADIGRIILYPSHRIMTAYRTASQVARGFENRERDAEILLGCLTDSISGIATRLGTIALTGAGAYAYYKAYEAGHGYLLAVPLITNVYDALTQNTS